ncbi:MAG: DAK2 domain-containing protein [Bacilli bacterium]|nr:DAK2 domain-containing protein [Bacilli bacterium]
MKTINGQTLKKIFISGSNNLYNFYPEIDALNVFPVPDGDTGMNMNLTLSSGCKEIKNNDSESAYAIAKSFSRGLLMGARGNSGVITSQIFRGFAEGLQNIDELTVKDLSEAFENGVRVAYKAVVKPVEGTILTVIREASALLAEQVRSSMSFEKAFEILIKEAKASLERTPNLLPVLKKAGVIDSGGAGLVKILEGMRSALVGKDVERTLNSAFAQETTITAAGASMEEEEFGYCTEFIMELGPDSVKAPFDEASFTQALSDLGTSLVVVRDEEIVKVHVHTMTPGDALNYAQQFGEFLKLKIENMTEQHHALVSGGEVTVTEDLVKEPENSLERTKNAIIAVSSGAGIDALFKELGVKVIVKGGQTMNPSSEDFLNAIKKANAENIYILPNNSNIVMAANQAKDLVNDIANVYVVPSKTIPQGVSAASMFYEDADGEENFNNMSSALQNVKSGEITFAVRNTEIDGVSVKKDDFIGIFDKSLVTDQSSKVNATTTLLDKMIDEDENSIITILVGQDVTAEEKQQVVDYINEKYPDFDVDLRDGKQPVYSFLIGVE